MKYTPYYEEIINPVVEGYVFDQAGEALSGVEVYLGGYSAITDSHGHYLMNPLIAAKLMSSLQ
jgi:hypothetical protein